MLLEAEGITDISPRNLYLFFGNHKDLDERVISVRNVKKTLNLLSGIFPEKTPELSNDSWVLDLCLPCSHLQKEYALKGRERDLHSFYIRFWKDVEGARRKGKGSASVLRFADLSRAGTTSKKHIQTRHSIMLREFLNRHQDLELLDKNRFFDTYEKAVIYRRDKGICQACGEEVKWDDYDADHIKAHAKGGKTAIENGQVLCSKCNKKKGAK